jgi:hypothetical protein
MDPHLIAEALYAGGHWMLERDRPLDAAHFFRQMLVAVPDDERAWLGLGECHERLCQEEAAFELYVAGYFCSTRRVRCGIAASRILRRRGENERAVCALDELEPFAALEELEELLEMERRAS